MYEKLLYKPTILKTFFFYLINLFFYYIYNKLNTTNMKVEIKESELKSMVMNALSKKLNETKKSAKQKKFDKVMGEFDDGTLKTSAGKKVTNKKQAIAIAYSESGLGEDINKVIKEGIDGESLSFQSGYGYWDVSKYPYGSDFKKFKGGETGVQVDGPVKLGGEIRVKLDDGREIVVKKQAIVKNDKEGGLDESITEGSNKKEELSRKFNTLNKKYLSIDKEMDKVAKSKGDTTKMEKELDEIQSKMNKISIELENLDENTINNIQLTKLVENIVRKALTENEEFDFVLKVTKANGDEVVAGSYNNKPAAIKAKNMIDPKFKPRIENKNKEGKITKNSFSKIKEGVEEELIGNQYKLDVNKNNKLDSDDFKQLRTEEETELVEGRPFQLGKGYTHFAIDKPTGKIINGYDYKGYSDEDLRSDKNYYFINDLADYFDFNEPQRTKKDVKIMPRKALEKAGINIADTNNWLK